VKVTKSAFNDKKQQVEMLFRSYFGELCGFGVKYVGDLETAKDIVHEVFMVIWEKYEALPADTNYKSYLFTAVRNRCLNHIRNNKKHIGLEGSPEIAADPDHKKIEALELAERIEEGLGLLPEKCREIFELSRVEELKYAAIAERLNISVKTVEGQMSKALRILRQHLSEFLALLLTFLWV
jgi:RNA polymerase sigma-70 factor (ECF subfamily)